MLASAVKFYLTCFPIHRRDYIKKQDCTSELPAKPEKKVHLILVTLCNIEIISVPFYSYLF